MAASTAVRLSLRVRAAASPSPSSGNGSAGVARTAPGSNSRNVLAPVRVAKVSPPCRRVAVDSFDEGDDISHRADLFDTSTDSNRFPNLVAELGDLCSTEELEALNSVGEDTCIGVIDMGSNSFTLVVVRGSPDGELQYIDQMKENVRLLEGSRGTNMITKEAMDRAVDALKRLQKIAQTRGAPLRAVATSAMREARNRHVLLTRIQEEIGMEVEVISGQEEARLIYSGVLQALPVFNKRVLCVDIGGGSTEFCIGHSGRPFLASSIPLGHLRLKEACFSEDAPLSPLDRVWNCRRLIRAEIADRGIVKEVATYGGGEVVVGCSGTIKACAEMISAASGNGGEPESLQDEEINISDLRGLVHSLVKAKTKEERMQLPGMQEKRQHTVTAGALLLLEIFEALNIKTMQVSSMALREGIIIDSLSNAMPSFQPFTDVRSESVAHLAKRFDVEDRYRSSLHSGHLALMLLQGLRELAPSDSPIHILTERGVALLMAGIHLHQVGMFLGHSGNHKHAYYIVKNSELLLGFTPLEVEIIALLTRFHRKRHPSMAKDAELKRLPLEMRSKVMVLIALVRMAVALDRRNSASAVASVKVSKRSDGTLEILLAPSTEVTEDGTEQPADISLEAWAAEQELKFLSKTIGHKVMLTVPGIGEFWPKAKKADKP